MKSLPTKILFACAAMLAFAMPQFAEAASIVFDDFNVNEGHFTSTPATGSGSSLNIAATSTADRVTTDGPIEGAGQQKLVLNATTVGSSMRLRHLSGGGTPANNIAFTTTDGVDGWIGLYVKTADATVDTNWTVQIWIEGASVNNNSVPKSIIADGAWHLYEWNLDDFSGVGDGWETAGILTGSTTISNSTHTIDSVLFRNATGPATSTLFMDFVGKTDHGSLSNLLATPCLKTSGVLVGGPLSTDSNQVIVTGVLSAATNLTVYQNTGPSSAMVPLGSKTNGIVVGNNSVTVSGLVKGARVVATQTINGQESCLPPNGILVGGGANPRLRIAASIRQPALNTAIGPVAGPIGRNGGGPASDIYWIHATNANVAGGIVLQPSTNWQTVVFYPWDSHYLWNNNNGLTFPDPNQFGIFEGLSVAPDDASDPGPFNIYIDNFRNADVLIQDFENQTNGTQTVLFNQPGFSGTTAGSILDAPNSCVVAQDNSASGTNAARLQWQFANTSGTWVRLTTAATATLTTPNPVVDLTQPIAVDILVLPVGQTAGHSLGLLMGPTNLAVCPGAGATFSIAATPAPGTGTYTYQWQRNGVNIAGATASSFATNNVRAASAGIYSVVIGDGAASNTLSAQLTVYPSVQIDASPFSPFTTDVGGQISLAGGASAPSTPCTSLPAAYQWLLNGVAIPGATGDTANGVAYNKNNAQVADAGAYTFIASNLYQTVTSDVCQVYVVDTARQVIGTGTGLYGLYYSNHLSSAPFTGTAAWTNTDPGATGNPFSFDWGTAEPDANFNFPSLVSTDYFTVRWVGQIAGQWNQTYNFYATCDDGMRVFIGGRLVVDSWLVQGPAEHAGLIPIALTTNAPQDIIIEYFENTGGAVAKLSWESASQVKDFVSSSQLYPATSWQPPVVSLTAPANDASFAAPGPINLSANVASNHNAITAIQFYANATNLIGQATTPPYAFAWNNAAGGAYSISARAVYNVANSVNSAANNITVTSQTPPFISGIQFAAGNFTIGGTGAVGQTFILLTATNLVPPINWQPAATNTAANGSFSFPVTPGANPASFFKVQSK